MTCSKLLQSNITISILFINFGFEMLAGNKCVEATFVFEAG